MKRFVAHHAGDAAACAVLLAVACAVFREAVINPSMVPDGIDLLQHYARESVLRGARAAGTPPWWNPFEFSGFPLQADAQVGVFYPPSVLLRVLPVPAFLTWTVVFHVWLFGAGCYALCRYYGVSRLAATMASLALMLSGVVMPRVHAGHLDVLRSLAWTPLALAAAFRALDRGGGWPRAAAVAVLCGQALGSFAQIVAYTWACIAAYAVFSCWWPAGTSGSRGNAAPIARDTHDGPAAIARDTRGGPTAIAREYALLLILVAGVTAMQWLPTARLVLAGGRVSGMPYDVASAVAFGSEEFLRSLTPPFVQTAARAENWETSSYVGVLLPVLAPFALLWPAHRRAASFLALLAAATIALASGGPLYRLHHEVFPMFRIPGRLLVFWAISVGALGAVTLHRLIAARATPGRTGGSGRSRKWLTLTAVCLAGAVVVTDAVVYARQFVRPRRFDERFVRELPFEHAPGGRVLSLCEGRIHPLEIAALGVPSVDGYNSYYLADYARLIRGARGEATDAFTPAGARLGALPALPDMGVVNQLNVTEILSCEPLQHEELQAAGTWGPLRIYRNAGAPGRVRAVAVDGDHCSVASITARGQGLPPASDDAAIRSVEGDRTDGRLRFLFSGSRPHLLYLSEPYYPERRAFVDGVEQPVVRANVALSAMCVEAGEHLVELRYVPSSLRLGSVISAATVLTWLAVPLARRRLVGRAHVRSADQALRVNRGADETGIRAEDDLHRHG